MLSSAFTNMHMGTILIIICVPEQKLPDYFSVIYSSILGIVDIIIALYAGKDMDYFRKKQEIR